MQRERRFGTTAPALLSMLAALSLPLSARALEEDFESYDDKTPIEDIANWEADTAGNDATAIKVRRVSMSGDAASDGIGAAGYNDSKGLEFSNQKSTRRELTDAEVIATDAGPEAVFEAKVRLSDIQGNKRPATSGHSFALLIGKNLGWDGSQADDEVIVLDDAVALAVVFYQKDGERSIRVSNGTNGLDVNTESFIRRNTAAVPDAAWAMNTWYTVRVSDIELKTDGAGTNVTGLLHIATSDGATTVADGVTFTANKGAAQPAAGAFDQIDGLGFCNTLGNGLVNLDDLSLKITGK